MAEKASSVIQDALGEILVSAAEQTPESEEMSSAIRFLNRMMASWSTRGLALGYTVITSPSDDVTVPDGALDGIIASLAVRLAPQYDAIIPQELAIAVKDGMDAIRKIAVVIRPSSFPCTLPIGSGNEQGSDFIDDKFYPCTSDNSLTEEGGNIQLESGT